MCASPSRGAVPRGLTQMNRYPARWVTARTVRRGSVRRARSCCAPISRRWARRRTSASCCWPRRWRFPDTEGPLLLGAPPPQCTATGLSGSHASCRHHLYGTGLHCTRRACTYCGRPRYPLLCECPSAAGHLHQTLLTLVHASGAAKRLRATGCILRHASQADIHRFNAFCRIPGRRGAGWVAHAVMHLHLSTDRSACRWECESSGRVCRRAA